MLKEHMNKMNLGSNRENSEQFIKNINVLKQISDSDETVRKIAKLITTYRSDYCQQLEKKIRSIIDYICDELLKREIDFCAENTNEVITTLCKLYDLYRKYCCKPCCTPKITEWGTIIDTVNVIYRELTPDVLSGDGGPGGIDLEPPKPVIICEEARNQMNKLIEIICKNRKQDLCSDNDLTRSITELCKIFPTYKDNCCK